MSEALYGSRVEHEARTRGRLFQDCGKRVNRKLIGHASPKATISPAASVRIPRLVAKLR
jgi:hypothetical protein